MSLSGPLTGQTSGHSQDRADVELRIPADGAYVSVLRTTTAGLAARLDFPIDDIEDLRIAVGEASAMVLPEADEAADLVCRFFMSRGRLCARRAEARLRQLRLAGADHAGHERLGRHRRRAVHHHAHHGVR